MEEEEQPRRGSHFVGKKDELIEEKHTVITVGGRDILVVHHQGVFYALDCYCYRKLYEIFLINATQQNVNIIVFYIKKVKGHLRVACILFWPPVGSRNGTFPLSITTLQPPTQRVSRFLHVLVVPLITTKTNLENDVRLLCSLHRFWGKPAEWRH